MEARSRSWWRQIKRPLSIIGMIAVIVLVIVLIVGIIGGYIFNWGWAGLTRKTLWDWLQLLIIPAVLAVGGYLFAFTISRNERKAADRHNQTEREIAQDNQREDALQKYIDKMSELLLHEKLRESKPEDEIRNVARVRTLSVLTQLDTKRKGSIFHFLNESHLTGIINLNGADLSGIKAHFIDLSGAMLSGVNLSGADLGEADLSEADLSHAKLNYANLSDTNLEQANLSHAMLEGAYLFTANLRGANLENTILSKADLTAANLSEASLKSFTILRDANLTQTNFKNAKMSDFVKSQLKKIKDKPENL